MFFFSHATEMQLFFSVILFDIFEVSSDNLLLR